MLISCSPQRPGVGGRQMLDKVPEGEGPACLTFKAGSGRWPLGHFKGRRSGEERGGSLVNRDEKPRRGTQGVSKNKEVPGHQNTEHK